MSITRRELLKRSTLASLTATMTSMGLPQAAHASVLSAASLATMLVIDPEDLEYKASGVCCPLCPGTSIVNHYLPVAFVEVTKGGLDSIVMDLGATNVGGNLDVGTADNDFSGVNNNVRIWDIPYYLIDEAMLGAGCKLCDRSYATPGPTQLAAQVASIPIEVACNGGNVFQEALNKTIDAIASKFPLQCVPRIMYDSAYDPSWRNSCRDAATAAGLYGHAGGVLCGSELVGTIMAALGIDITGGLDPCVGGWGPLYPRQMRVDGTDALTAAALTAYRGLHVAGYATGTMPYKVDLGGKLKWVYPDKNTAMSPGISGKIFNFGVGRSDRDVYGFTWYAPVTCCKDVLTLTAPCIPAIPCQGTSIQ